MKKIVVDSGRGPAAEADFRVLKWTAQDDVLEVVVSYSGGCEEHEFNAYFSGVWDFGGMHDRRGIFYGFWRAGRQYDAQAKISVNNDRT